MLKRLYILLFCFLFVSALSAQQRIVRVIDFTGLRPYLHHQTDTTYVINFWATWCAPCVKEMPVFLQAEQKYKNKEVKFLFVSLDIPSNLESRVIPFVEKQGITSEVILLDDPNSNAWIDKVDAGWSGSIPATLIYNKHSRDFYEKTFGFEELDSIVQLKLKKL